jgi:hypothetical protein
MSDNEIEIGSIYLRPKSNQLEIEQIYITNNVGIDNHEPLSGSTEWTREMDIDHPSGRWGQLKLSNDEMTIEFVIGTPDEAREFVNWLDKEVSKWENAE